MSNIKRVYLFPVDSHKSFYNKCYVEEQGDAKALYSYNTCVAYFFPGVGIRRVWDGWSATTQRHINAFAAYCGINASGKAWWNTVEYL